MTHGFTTKAIHSPYPHKDPHGSLRMPVYDSVSFEFSDTNELEKAFLGQKPAHLYSRITNPTIEELEFKIKHITDSLGVVALSSGMAAISNVVTAIAKTKDNIITSKKLFGNTYSIFDRTFRDWGLETRFVDLNQIDEIESRIDSHTKAIFFETITNPHLEIVDISSLSKLARKHKIPLIADSTLTPLYFFNAKELGIDLEVISSTKYISGGATCVGGVIIDHGTFNWKNNSKLENDAKKFGPFTLLMKLKKEVFRNLGACLSPHHAYLQSLGLETLALRAEKSSQNALDLAKFLYNHPKVKSVNYPGLSHSPYHDLALKQFGELFGSLLTFDLQDKKTCFSLMNHLKLTRKATNLNDNKTLILHPASTIFCEYPESEKEEMGIRDSMIRVALGIEDSTDIINDFKNALKEI